MLGWSPSHWGQMSDWARRSKVEASFSLALPWAIGRLHKTDSVKRGFSILIKLFIIRLRTFSVHSLGIVSLLYVYLRLVLFWDRLKFIFLYLVLDAWFDMRKLFLWLLLSHFHYFMLSSRWRSVNLIPLIVYLNAFLLNFGRWYLSPLEWFHVVKWIFLSWGRSWSSWWWSPSLFDRRLDNHCNSTSRLLASNWSRSLWSIIIEVSIELICGSTISAVSPWVSKSILLCFMLALEIDVQPIILLDLKLGFSWKHNILLNYIWSLLCPFVILLSLMSRSLIVPVVSPPLIIPIHFLFGRWSRVRHCNVGRARLAILWALVFTYVWSVSVRGGARVIWLLLLSYC